MLAEVINIPQNDPCQMCNPCVRMRLMEFGIMVGKTIDIQEKMKGMFLVNLLSENGNTEQTIALRKDELERICYKLK